MAAPNLIEITNVSQFEENRTRRAARILRPKWNPKKWHPVYQEVVLLSCMGMSNKAIAIEKGFTKEHVSNILRTPQAEIIRQLTIKKMEQKHELTLEQRFERLANRALDRVENVMEDDQLFEKNPLGVFDRAIVVLKGTNKIKSEETKTPNGPQPGMVVSEDVALKLVDALAMSDRVAALHGTRKLTLEGRDQINTLPPSK